MLIDLRDRGDRVLIGLHDLLGRDFLLCRGFERGCRALRWACCDAVVFRGEEKRRREEEERKWSGKSPERVFSRV